MDLSNSPRSFAHEGCLGILHFYVIAFENPARTNSSLSSQCGTVSLILRPKNRLSLGACCILSSPNISDHPQFSSQLLTIEFCGHRDRFLRAQCPSSLTDTLTAAFPSPYPQWSSFLNTPFLSSTPGAELGIRAKGTTRTNSRAHCLMEKGEARLLSDFQGPRELALHGPLHLLKNFFLN